MIHLDVEQGSPEWLDARLGIPTCSKYDSIITPKTMKPSSGTAYRNQLLSEWFVGHPIDWTGQSQWMERGKELEPQARAFYEFKRDVEAQQVGLILRDDRLTGGSPDSLVGDDGGLEIKCPSMHVHVGYLLDPQKLVDEYRCPVQGYLYITGRKWWDLMSYNPSMPEVIVRVLPDPPFQKALHECLDAFLKDLEEAQQKLAPHRVAEPALP